MDTTPKYILMCEKAEKIQKLWKPKDGDFYSLGYLIEVSHCCPCGNEDDMGTTEASTGTNDNWLPRQDQLQEMVDCTDSPAFFVLFRKINSEIATQRNNCSPLDDRYLPDYLSKFKTDEQLWLAFVMKEKYQKVWSETKKDWVKDYDVSTT